MYRDASQFKLANTLIDNDQEVAEQRRESDSGDDWRWEIFRNAEHAAEMEDSSSKGEPPQASETGARPKRKRQPPRYLEDYVV